MKFMMTGANILATLDGSRHRNQGRVLGDDNIVIFGMDRPSLRALCLGPRLLLTVFIATQIFAEGRYLRSLGAHSKRSVKKALKST